MVFWIGRYASRKMRLLEIGYELRFGEDHIASYVETVDMCFGVVETKVCFDEIENEIIAFVFAAYIGFFIGEERRVKDDLTIGFDDAGGSGAGSPKYGEEVLRSVGLCFHEKVITFLIMGDTEFVAFFKSRPLSRAKGIHELVPRELQRGLIVVAIVQCIDQSITKKDLRVIMKVYFQIVEPKMDDLIFLQLHERQSEEIGRLQLFYNDGRSGEKEIHAASRALMRAWGRRRQRATSLKHHRP